jgi:hypothetical protein
MKPIVDNVILKIHQRWGEGCLRRMMERVNLTKIYVSTFGNVTVYL